MGGGTGRLQDGRHVRWLLDNIDITEKKESEEALRRSLVEPRRLKAQLQSENQLSREEAERATEHGPIIGRSPAVARILEQVELVGATSSIVLITGETGTGKELVARAIHQHSDRRRQLRRPARQPRGKRGHGLENQRPARGRG